MADPLVPDQQAAGVAPGMGEPISQGGLLDALRSRGTLPAMLPAQMLAQSMGQAGPGPNAGLGVGSAMLNAAHGGNPALNPYLQQYQAQQNEQVKQGLQYQQLQQHQTQLQQKQNEMSLTIQKDLLFGPNRIEDEKVRGPLAQTYGKSVSAQIGMPLPEGVMRSWTNGGPSMESQKKLAILLNTADSQTDPDLRASMTRDAQTFYMQHGGQPQGFEAMAATLRDPTYRKAAGLPDNMAIQKDALELQDKFRKDWVARHPAFADVKNERGHVVEGGVAGYADEIARKNFGRSLFDLRDDVPADAALIQALLEGGRMKAKLTRQTTMEQDLEAKRNEEKYKSDLIEQRTGRLLEKRAQLFPPKPSSVGVMNQQAAEKALQPLTDAENAISDLAMLNAALKRAADKGLIPTSTGMGEAWRARAAQAWNYNDADILAIKQTILPMIIGKIDRGLFDEKNVRFKQAFEEQMRIAQSLPTVEAFKKLSDMYNYMFARNAARRLYNLEGMEGQRNPDVVAHAKEQFAIMYPDGIPGDPSLLPPGSHYEYRNKQPVIVLDNGKGEYDQATGQWVPRAKGAK